MKNPLAAFLPALALLALGGCAGTSALTSSEDDGVYYSSRDRTTAVVNTPTPSTPISTEEAANPDYNGSSNSSSARQGNSGSDQYYDNTYTYMHGVPNYGVTSYAPYSPYTTLSYGAGSAWGGGSYGFSPFSYGFYDPFYSSFNNPFYGYGSGINISISFGRPYGYGGYGYGRPYGYGYGGGFYDPYYYSSPFYGGYYGRGGYYGNNYGSYYGNNYGSNGGYYGNNYGSNGGYYGNDLNRRNTTPGHRADRMSDGRYSTDGVSTSNPTTTPGGGRPRSTMDGRMSPGTGMQPLPAAGANTDNRARGEAVPAAPSPQPTRADESYNRPRRMDGTDQPRYRNMEQPTTGQGQVNNDNSRGRWRNTEVQPQGGQPQPTNDQPMRQEGQRRRGGFFQDVFTQPANQGQGGGQAADQQPTRQRSYEQPQQQQPQRTYEQPRQRTYEQPQQRSYEQPQQRSYEQPQRSYSQPSYSAPSNGGGSGGGGGHTRGRGE